MSPIQKEERILLFFSLEQLPDKAADLLPAEEVNITFKVLPRIKMGSAAGLNKEESGNV